MLTVAEASKVVVESFFVALVATEIMVIVFRNPFGKFVRRRRALVLCPS